MNGLGLDKSLFFKAKCWGECVKKGGGEIKITHARRQTVFVGGRMKPGCSTRKENENNRQSCFENGSSTVKHVTESVSREREFLILSSRNCKIAYLERERARSFIA